jgi:uncharacterized Zn finger protein (UPF0148 family)
MSFFKRLTASLRPEPSTHPPLTCPHCGTVLDIEPKGKRKCPACRELIVPKKLHDEKFKRFVTEEQAAQIDTVNKEYYRQERIDGLKAAVREAHRDNNRWSELVACAKLEAELGNRDRAWGYYNQACIETARLGDRYTLGLTRQEMARFLKKEGRYEQMLSLLSESCYLQYMPESLVSAFPPAALREMALAMNRSGTDVQALREVFLLMASKHKSKARRDPSPEHVWHALQEALLDYI